jgi:hypothetical protein
MANPEEFPAFAGSGDSREEALWQAYQAMLRRRTEGRAARPAAEPDPLAPHLTERSRPLAAPPLDAPAPPARGGRGAAGRRAALGAAVVLAGGAALAVALWPHSPDPAATRDRAAAVEAPRPTLPCFVGGRLIGRLTLDVCASRNGLASGSLDTGPVERPVPNPAPRDAVTSAPMATAPPGIRSPAPVAEPPIAEAAPPPRTSFPTRPLAASEGYPPLEGSHGAPEAAPPPPRAALVEPRRASTLAVREFYRALGEGDGVRAAAVVIPEKRAEGPLSAGELTRFYSSLRAPLRLTQVDPLDDDTVFVRYQFITPDSHLCSGAATVNTAHRDGDTLVSGIRALNGC